MFRLQTEVSGVFIQQRIELFEAVSGCETPNKYNLFPFAKDFDWKKDDLLESEYTALPNLICFLTVATVTALRLILLFGLFPHPRHTSHTRAHHLPGTLRSC